jgi:endonuclease/exonuclease/phosphatase family metal-dependent hydrolase
MNAARGDLPRLVQRLESGQLTCVAPAEYVLLLQEATATDDGSVPLLPTRRRLSAAFVPVRHDGRVTRGNAIVATTPLADVNAVALPRERQPRAALTAAITVGGSRLFVVSTHLENRVSWWLGGPLIDTARGRQAEALVRALPTNRPGIVGGDMNTWLGVTEPAWRVLRRRFPDTPPDEYVPAATFRDRLALDHLFFDLPEGWRAERRVVPDTYGSDHRPVLGLITKEIPNPKSQIPNPKPQIPSPKTQAPIPSSNPKDFVGRVSLRALGFGIWDLGFGI